MSTHCWAHSDSNGQSANKASETPIQSVSTEGPGAPVSPGGGAFLVLQATGRHLMGPPVPEAEGWPPMPERHEISEA